MHGRLGSIAVGVACIGLALAPAGAAAGTITPTDGTDEYNIDSGHCSLRESIQAAQGTGTFDGCVIPGGDSDADTIALNPAVSYQLSIVGDEDFNVLGDLDSRGAPTDQNLTITTSGPGRATIDANGDGMDDLFPATDDRVLHIGAGGNPIANTHLSNLDITDGEVGTALGGGGGIRHEGGINLFIDNSVIRENKATNGSAGGISIAAGFPLITETEISDNTAATIGGVHVDDGAPAFIGSTIEGNQATDAVVGDAGGVKVDAGESASLIDSTVSGNSADLSGGGLYVAGTLNLANATVAGNTADADSMAPAGDGGGAFNPTTLNARNSLIADNVDASFPPGPPTSSAVDPDCAGTITSQGYNLIETSALDGMDPDCSVAGDLTGVIPGVDPALGPLAAGGGATRTHRLLPSSPALHAGNPATPGSGGFACESTDQRGFVRPPGMNFCDMGAYEAQEPDLAPVGDKTIPAEQTLSFTLIGSDPDPLDTLTYSGGPLPAGATVNPTTGVFSWTPTAAQVGSHPAIVFEVGDGIFASAETSTITVTPPVVTTPPGSPPTQPPVTNPTATGLRAAALKRCKRKKGKARKKCKRRALKLPV